MNEREIFGEALRRGDASDQSEYLDGACAGDPALRRRVEALLGAHREAGGFLERPAAELLGAGAAPDEAGAIGETRAEPPEGEGPALDFLEPPRRPGSLGRLGHYDILEVVGRGGMGVVLRAFDEKLHRTVAIKVMASELAASAPARKRFIREARAAAAVSHEHVVTIHAVDEGHRPPYLVMQFVEGASLQEKLDRSGPLGVAEILRIGFQVAQGLAAAHQQGLVHRDVKPANILLENGVERVKLTDFGLARVADDASVTQSGVIAGTPQYMSPEQAAGQPLDHRSDLFSLGSVLYAMCTGRPPFRAGSALAVLRRVADESPRPIREASPEIPGWLCDLVARLHAKDPSRRARSAAECAELLAGGLARLQQPEEGRAIPPGGKPPRVDEFGGIARPGRRRWAAAAVGALVLAAGLGATEATGVTGLSRTVIRLFGSEGTLVVEVDDPGVSVAIDGRDLVITGAGPKEIRLGSGPHRVTARKDGEVILQEQVTIEKDGRPVVRVRRPAGRASKELEQLVELARRDCEWASKRFEAGQESFLKVIEARSKLIEAKLRLAVAKGDGEGQDRLFAEMEAACRDRLALVRKQHEQGIVPLVKVGEAESAIVEARLRWAESRAARGEPEPPSSPEPQPAPQPGPGPAPAPPAM